MKCRERRKYLWGVDSCNLMNSIRGMYTACASCGRMLFRLVPCRFLSLASRSRPMSPTGWVSYFLSRYFFSLTSETHSTLSRACDMRVFPWCGRLIPAVVFPSNTCAHPTIVLIRWKPSICSNISRTVTWITSMTIQLPLLLPMVNRGSIIQRLDRNSSITTILVLHHVLHSALNSLRPTLHLLLILRPVLRFSIGQIGPHLHLEGCLQYLRQNRPVSNHLYLGDPFCWNPKRSILVLLHRRPIISTRIIFCHRDR